jgi:hypothetical protein
LPIQTTVAYVKRYRLLDTIGNDLGPLVVRTETWKAGDLIRRADGDLRIIRVVAALAGDDQEGYLVVEPASHRSPG